MLRFLTGLLAWSLLLQYFLSDGFLCTTTGTHACYGASRSAPVTTRYHAQMSSNSEGTPLFPELRRCLTREYASFFNPMDRSFYASDVEFIDPLTSFRGIDKYQNNVDMLAGRKGMIGKLLFKDASIALHSIEVTSASELETRWTLQVTVRVPGNPRARFTGISKYTVNKKGIVVRQVDYWDSVNLVNGKYESKSFAEGLKDFLSQTRAEDGAVQNAPELPVS